MILFEPENNEKKKKSATPAGKKTVLVKPNKCKKMKEDNEVNKLFGVHTISVEDIENHFATSEDKLSGETPKEDAPAEKSQNN